MSNQAITDDALTAYLDGEADAALTAQINAAVAEDETLDDRLAALSIDKDVLQDAFGLDALTPPAYLPQRPDHNPRWVLPTAVAASFAAGLFIMSMALPATPDWVDRVASYQALYVTDTLSGPAQSPQRSEAVLQQAQDFLGVDLRAATRIAELDFKRAQILAIDGQPLIQMAYLDANGVPFAFCVTSADQSDRAVRQMISHGLATHAWVRGGVGYMLIGGQDLDATAAFSKELQQLL